jgi:GH15 family glucan-1,4-alpha-glucosidase
MASPLEHYGLIGDLTTIALISRTGSLDWLCLPRIDSDACFARLLGNDDHGYWTLRPAAEVRSSKQRYRQDTLILEMEVTCDTGRVRVIDFMPPGAVEHDVIRIVEGLEGEVPMHCDLKVRFAYGKLIPWIRGNGREATFVSGPDALAFSSPVPIEPDPEEARAWRDWLMRAIAGAPAQAQIMYGIAGEHRLTEVELPWLPGYEESRPVRIGNGAYDQFQLDVYGETLNTLYEARVHGAVQKTPLDWDLVQALIGFVAKNWQRPFAVSTDETRSPDALHGGGDREGAHLGWARPPLLDRHRGRRAGRPRGDLPHLQLLAGGQLRDGRAVLEAKRKGHEVTFPAAAAEAMH